MPTEDDVQGSAPWRATHRDLSALDLQFRETAHASPELLDRSRFDVLDQKTELLNYRLQSWPTFLGSAKLAELKRVSLGMNRLLRKVPERVFRNDARKLAAFYGIGPAVAEVLFLPPTGAETMFSRGDFIDTAAGFQCIEFNFTAKLGGWDTTLITGLHLAVPPTARFIADAGIRVAFTDTMVEMFRHVVEDIRRKKIIRDGRFTIAFLFAPAEVAAADRGLEYLNRELRRTLELMGLDLDGRVVNSAHERLVPARDGMLLGNQRIDALVELSGPATPPRVYLLFKQGLVGLYNGPLSTILSSKRNLALLSQHAGSFSSEEQAFIEAHVPWTRLVAAGAIEYQGETRPLPELLTARRERFVLKDAASWGGKGVVLGRDVSPERWREAVDGALTEGQWVVQEIQESLPYLYQSGESGCAIHDMIWGPFVFGDRYGGVVLRMQPRAVGGPVSASLYATEGIAFEV
jgi:hypothetical protein